MSGTKGEGRSTMAGAKGKGHLTMSPAESSLHGPVKLTTTLKSTTELDGGSTSGVVKAAKIPVSAGVAGVEHDGDEETSKVELDDDLDDSRDDVEERDSDTASVIVHSSCVEESDREGDWEEEDADWETEEGVDDDNDYAPTADEDHDDDSGSDSDGRK